MVWLLLAALVLSCNADPKKIGKKVRVIPHKEFLSELSGRWSATRVPLFAKSGARETRVVLRPADIPLLSNKRQEAGVLVQGPEQATETLRLLEWASPRQSVECATDWVLHVFEPNRTLTVEFQWECKSMRIGGQNFDLEPAAQKMLGNLITTARLHPTHKATVLAVPVVHDPEHVSQLVSGFVQEVLPQDVSLMRFPSFTVSTEHFETITSDFTRLDEQVAQLRGRLKKRLTDFAIAIRTRGGASVVKVLDPVALKERFSQELFARWGMTVLCALGTGTDRMYYLASASRFGIARMEVPTHYPMLVVQLPVTDPRPGLAAQLAAMHLDPPLVWP
ncbi:MAG: hypothetical protein CVU65_11755 [Deltaproteobacteria bacterium HGW-Deltaproteobacteria-22]|nr:MAG: hypothetical protein CVU65_11755 [Deltaproteobacteria bacterium HGW-Deltaproteobacteria-22]